MRLTLRTLLAYMDGVLEPADAADIEEKIRESEFASGMVNRIRDVVRQLRLGAPRVRGKGMGLDPNTVAEYLDNTLPTEQVPDFEKACLESDTQLAEVAACHQVLTLVLGEPAEVTADSRERMYGLLTEAKRAKAETVEQPMVEDPSGNGFPLAPEEPASVEDQPKPQRAKPEVPDYLREPSGRPMWPVAAALLMLIMLVCVVVLAVGHENIMALFTGDETPQAVSMNQADTPELPQGEVALEPATEEPDSAKPPTPDAANLAAEIPEPVIDETEVVAEMVEENVEPSTPEAELSNEPPVPGNMPVVPSGEAATAANSGRPATSDEQPEMSQPPEVAASEAAEEAMADPPEPAAVLPAADANAGGENEVPSLLGRFVSDRTVLLKFNTESSTWERLPARAGIGPGDRLLAMPAFDATLALGTGINIVLLGGTMVEFGPPDASGAPMLRIHYGRVLMMTAGGDQRGIHLVADGQQGWLGLAGPNSIAAVEAVRTMLAGSDPETEAAPLIVNLYVGQGEVTWRTAADAQPVTLSAPYQHTLGSEVETAGQPLPQWVVQNTTPLIEQRGAEFIEEHLSEERTIATRGALKELVDHRRSEVKALAARSLVHLGVYDPVIKALGNPPQHAAWPALIAELAQAMVRSPEEAKSIREAFELERGAEGDKLYRLLRGYSPEQLRDGAANELVSGLDNEAVDIRVLSFWNLHQITGEMNAYRADHTAARRKPAVQKWREQLDAGEIVSWNEANPAEPGEEAAEGTLP